MSCSQRRDPSQNQQDDIQVALPLTYILLQLFFSLLCVSESCKVVELFKSCKFVRWCDHTRSKTGELVLLYSITRRVFFSSLKTKNKTKQKTKAKKQNFRALIQAWGVGGGGGWGVAGYAVVCLGIDFAVVWVQISLLLLFLAFVY